MSLASRLASRRTGALAALGLLIATAASAGTLATSKTFEGPKANTGTVTFSKEGMDRVLTLSDDFVVPDTPDPHWRVVDSAGNVYLLERLPIKGDKVNRSIVLPPYVKDVAKVQIWCAFAQVVLGETTFDRVQR